MTTEEITDREQACERYVEMIERKCRELDHEQDRQIDGLPWLTRSGSDYAAKPEIRREW